MFGSIRMLELFYYFGLVVTVILPVNGLTVDGRRLLTGNEVISSLMSQEGDSCAHQMSKVYNRDVSTPYPPTLAGEWVSTRCEVRPGPEFMLRKYQFYDNSRFSLYQFYYDDSNCQRPVYAIVARGSYSVFQPSWLLPGATEVDYELNQVSVMPYTDKMADLLGAKVNRTCPGFVPAAWQKKKWYDIFNYIELADVDSSDEEGYLILDRDCLRALSFSVHELQLLKVEIRKRHGHALEKVLYMGDIHTEPRQRAIYRPTGFQEPLMYGYQAIDCPVCDALSDSDEYNPPSLTPVSRPRLSLSGSWFSVQCEIHPNGVFLTRHLSFDENSLAWEGYFHHFLDSDCQRPQFSLYVKGKFSGASSSRFITDAYEVDFQVLKAGVKPTDSQIVRMLNQDIEAKSCGIRKWRLGEEQDVSVTDGCRLLGLTLPHTEYELVKLVRKQHHLQLYFGQRPTHGTVFSPADRPTSFQGALRRCSDHTRPVTPPYSFHTVTTQPVEYSSAGVCSQPWCLLLTLALCLLTLVRSSKDT